MKPAAKVTELDIGQVEEVLNRIEEVMGKDTVHPLRLLLKWCLSIQALLQEKTLTIARLRRLVFGSRTERTRDVISEATQGDEPAGDEQQGSAVDSKDSASSEQEEGSASDSKPSSSNAAKPGQRPRKGHGRIPAAAYTGCERVVVTNRFCPGDSCPRCQHGTLYQQESALTIRLKGQPPIGGTCYERERLRCGTCGELTTAELPEEAGASKYDDTVASTIATLRYGEGLPWNRIERLQRAAGIPLPCSVQWELVRDAAERGPRAVYKQLLWEAAQGELIHNDDTYMRVRELATKVKKGEPLREDDPNRTGVYTTGILSMAENRPTIALFITGARHSGENMRRLLEQRTAELSPPIQMCDALSHNMPDALKTILANCLSHARRKFVDVAGAFPDEVEYLLECLKKVYRTDAAAKRFKLSAENRLRLHQRRSGPVMNELHQWLKERLEQRKVEPNSSLGNAIQYMLTHWDRLTLFLRKPGVPLDNNICERALKMAIRHRRNSLFYKTLRGAEVGDVYMSLIHTCYMANADPFGYITALLRNAKQVLAEPRRWLPWNYDQQPDTS